MVSSLPPDLIILICEELANQNDFSTLFNCAVSGRQLAGSALMWMYRMHTQTSIRSAESSETEIARTGLDQQQETTKKWSLQWRSIILSAMDKTEYPYCLYIRSLELNNLEELLQDPFFREEVSEDFFAGDMATFHIHDTPIKLKKGKKIKVSRLKVSQILELVGDAISEYVGASADHYGRSAALEELSGPIGTDSLPIWVARFSRLKSISLWDGGILNGAVGQIIKSHCHNFDALACHHCTSDRVEDGDTELASFFKALAPNTLKYLQIISHNNVGPQTLAALTAHKESLTELSLANLKAPAIKALSALRVCTKLQTIDLEDTENLINLEATAYDTFQEIIDWLTSCKQLNAIRLANFIDGPAILRALCLRPDIRLRSLSLVRYALVNNQDFHRSLMAQTYIESLELRADAEDSTRDDIDTLVSSLCGLKELRYLKLLETSDYFRTPEVQQLATNLPKLEEFLTAGYDITDAVWPSISELHHLRRLHFHALTTFSFESILNYIDSLQETNSGLLLSIMSASLESDLSADEQAIIREALADKVDGKFEFVLHREAESTSGDFSD